MTRKLWFQLGVGILLTLIIIKFFTEVNWIFTPILIILQTIFIPLLVSGVLFYITVPIQTFLEKAKGTKMGKYFDYILNPYRIYLGSYRDRWAAYNTTNK